MKCRHCKNELQHVFLDLGFAPPSNAYLTKDKLKQSEAYFPLRLFVCDCCWLVQTDDYADADKLFSSDYAYFSSISQSWLEHATNYSSMITGRLGLNSNSFVIEIASNDGYLLKNFVETGVPCLGIEPTDSTADVAEKSCVPVLREFFGESIGKQFAADGKRADLIIGNNVYAHVPDINDFTAGMKALLKPEGTITLEFPHLMRLIEYTQFDTVYHEHYSYLSLSIVCLIFEKVGLRIFDVEELSTHGGSLRVYGSHQNDPRSTSSTVTELIKIEKDQGLNSLEKYLSFQNLANKVKNNLLSFLLRQNEAGKKVVAYGAAAKGNTLLNYAGVKPDLLPFVCDAAPSKQGKLLPGSHIPILPPAQLQTVKPDLVLILPWNITDEVIKQHDYIREWGGQFVIVVPEVVIR